MKHITLKAIGLVVVLLSIPSMLRAESFNYSQALFGTPSTLSVSLQNVDLATGQITANGADTQCPTTPFTWAWGDGTTTTGFFPQQHTYADPTQNYIITLTAHYADGGTDTSQCQARFSAPLVTPVAHPANIQVTIPDSAVSLSSRMPGYTPPASLTYYDDSHFGVVPSSAIEHVLTNAASVQNGFVNGNVAEVGGGFQQYVLRDSAMSGGMYSLWYTDPVSFGAGNSAMQGSIPYSSFFHEMGHNFTLNSPAEYYYGGKIDGSANAIYSETMAQIFQHATAWELINNADAYGLSDDLVFDIETSALASIQVVRNAYDDYVAEGMNFCSWNDPATSPDETFDTFMTLAYKFLEQAELSGLGYAEPLGRMTELLQLFDEDMMNSYDRLHDNLDADTFRSTLMVSAVSYGFQKDLRSDFAALNFPIDDAAYNELVTAAIPEPVTIGMLATGALGMFGVILRRRK